ncbi:MAG: hypothetical protein ACE5EK_10820 [Nitrospinales bacterium]
MMFHKNLIDKRSDDKNPKTYSIVEIFIALSVSVMLLVFANQFSQAKNVDYASHDKLRSQQTNQ